MKHHNLPTEISELLSVIKDKKVEDSSKLDICKFMYSDTFSKKNLKLMKKKNLKDFDDLNYLDDSKEDDKNISYESLLYLYNQVVQYLDRYTKKLDIKFKKQKLTALSIKKKFESLDLKNPSQSSSE